MKSGFDIKLTPEQSLVVESARFDVKWPTEEALQLLSNGSISWDKLHNSARDHRMTGLLYLRLDRPDTSTFVPGPFLERLRQDYLQVKMQAVYMDAELKRVVEALNSEKIPAILLKGAALRKTVYTDPGARPMSDIDILVPAELAERAQRAVISLGYIQDFAEEELAHTELIGRHLPRLQSARTATAVEVHRHLVSADSPVQFDITGFWDRSTEIDIDGLPARIFSVEDQLIHLALNFMLDRRFHSAASIGQLADIAAVVSLQSADIEWERLQVRLDELGLSELTTPAFELARILLKAPVPEWACSASENDTAHYETLSKFARTRIFGSRKFFATVLDAPTSRSESGGAIRPFLRRLFPTRRYLVGKYGEHARGIPGTRYYFVRMFEGMRVLAPMALHPNDWRDNMMVNRWMVSLTKHRDAS